MTPGGPVLPTSGIVTLRPVSGSAGDSSALAGNAPRVTPGAILQGVVAGMNREGDPLVKTEAGDFSIKLPVHLKSGSEVVLRMDNTQGAMRARLLSVDGVKLADYLQTHGNKQPLPTDTTPLSPEQRANPAQAAINAQLQDVVSLSSGSRAGQNMAQILESQPALQAILLSRSPALVEILRRLPEPFPLPARIQPGDRVMMTLLGFEKPAAPTPPPAQQPTAGTPQPASPPQAQPTTTPTPNADATVKPAITTISTPLPPAAAESAASQAPASTSTSTSTSTPAPAPNQSTPTLPAADILNALKSAPNTAQASTAPQTTQALSHASISLSNVVAHLAAQEVEADALPNLQNLLPGKEAAAYSAQSASQPAAAVQSTAHLPTPSLQLSSTGKVMLLATMLEVTDEGEWLLQTPLGTVRTPPPQGLPQPPQGQLVRLELNTIQPGKAADAAVINNNPAATQTASRATLSEGMSFLALTQQWDTLEDAMSLIAAQNTSQSTSLLTSLLPESGPKLTTQMLFFLQALRGQDVKEWIGKRAVESLEKAQRQDLLQSLQKDFGKLHEALTSEGKDTKSPWQAMIFPFKDDDQIHMARLFVHRDAEQPHEHDQPGSGKGDDQDADDKPWKDTRFILELELSQLGDMQLSGLVRRKDTTHFDLVVRTHQNLPVQTQSDIRDIFEKGAALTGYQGQILFEVSKSFPERPLEQMIDPPADLTA